MISVQDLIESLRLEGDAVAKSVRDTDLLHIDSLEDQGRALKGLIISSQTKRQIVFQCYRNNSRFRAGDSILFENSGASFEGRIIDIRSNGCELVISPSKQVSRLNQGPWLAREIPIDLTVIFISALSKLHPGSPGWAFFNSVVDPNYQPYTFRQNDKSDVSRTLLDALIEESGQSLDEAQISCFLECMTAPHLFGVQGPPGTGKTILAAFVAEAMARQGKRILITAPTHQAVNNTLTTIHELFPQRTVLKIGSELRREALHDDIRCIVLRDEIKATPREVRNEKIIGATFVSAVVNFVLQRSLFSPNVLLIDEAGQLPLAQGVCAGLIGAGSILLFGDDRQMPPVFASEEMDKALALSLFEKLRNTRPDNFGMLQVSYRMNREICMAVSHAFYESVGLSAIQPSARSRDLKLDKGPSLAAPSALVAAVLAPDKSMVWFDTSSSDAREWNIEEAQFVCDVVTACVNAGKSLSELAVVTPFRRQVALIRNALPEKVNSQKDQLVIDTVERVQGLTVDVIIISICSSDIEYINMIGDFLFSPNRLNVAISRARKKVIVAASKDLWRAMPHSYDAVKSKAIFEKIRASSQLINY